MDYLRSDCEVPTYTVDATKVQGVDGPSELKSSSGAGFVFAPRTIEVADAIPFLHAARWLKL